MTPILHGNLTAFMDYRGEHEPQGAKHHWDTFDLVIVSDPSGDFRPGAMFPILDFIASLGLGVWPAGMKVRLNGECYTIQGEPGECVDETGQVWRASGCRLAKKKARKQ